MCKEKQKQQKKKHQELQIFSAERKLKYVVSMSTRTVQTHWERILNVCKSSWLTCIEVKWDVDIYYRPIAAKLTPQILRPEHRKYKYDSTDHSGQNLPSSSTS